MNRPARTDLLVYWTDIRLNEDRLNQYASILSSDELKRAARYIFDSDRNRFIVCRSILRMLLGELTNVAPGQLNFSYNEFGKPFLAQQTIEFNLSHSGNFAVYAFTKDSPVGIDIEKIDARVDCGGLSRRFFSNTELAELREIREDLRVKSFFDCWTRKEAYIKATGRGLSVPLTEFSVPVAGRQNLRLDEDPQWVMYDLAVHPDYSAAVVAARPSTILLLSDLPASLATFAQPAES